MEGDVIHFGDVLHSYMQREMVTADELSTRTKRTFGEYEGVPKSTIVHWIKRHVASPRDWLPIVKLAVALSLTESEANELLRPAKFPSVLELADQAATTTLRIDHATDIRIRNYLMDWNKLVPRGVTQNLSTFLHQLPAPKVDFIGRSNQLEKLATEMEKSGKVGVFGPGGVGKTALAIKLANTMVQEYSDAQLFVQLKGTSSNPASTSEVKKFIIRSFNRDEEIPEDENELNGLYNSVFHERKVLLVLDDAVDARQVGPLVPPEGCVVVITSRRRFALSGMYSMDLGQMNPDEAKTLLLKIEPRIGEFANDIARLCGYLPLALRLAGSNLSVRMDLSPEDYLKHLSDNRLAVIDEALEFTDEEKGIEASLNLSYQFLSQDMQDYWCELSILPDSFERLGASAVWELNHDATHTILSSLLSRSMLEWNKETRRYRLHDLSRVFAEKNLSKEKKDNCLRRHATHYLGVLRDANNLYEKGGESVVLGLSLFDTERENIIFAHAWATENSKKDNIATELTSSYPLLGWKILLFRLSPHEQIDWLDHALKSAEYSGNTNAQANHLKNLGVVYYRQGDLDQAVDILGKAIHYFKLIGDKKNEGRTVGNLGLVYADKGDFHRAIELYGQHLILSREAGDKQGESNAMGNLGNAYKNLGTLDKALELHNQALILSRELKDLYGEGTSLNDIGNVYFEKEEYKQAVQYYENSLSIFQEIGDSRDEGNALGNLGLVHYKLGNTDRAINFFEKALTIDKELGNRHGESITLNDLGRAYADLGNAQRGLELCDQALIISREIGDERGIAEAYWYKSYCLYLLGQQTQAIELAEQSIEMLVEQGVEDSTTKEVREYLANWKSD
ncbi:MAG: tetratricopeptide repeat protein [Candidatus Bathyarchaeia archaeon]